MSNYNTRIKIYPDGTVAQVMVASSGCFVDESREGKARPRVPSLVQRIEDTEAASAALGDKWEGERAENARRSRSRARTRVFDLAYCNDWRYFVTLTIDPQKIDSYDYNAVVRRLGQWLDNRVRRRGLKYICVPEYHKSGRVHFHGLVNDALPVVDSGHKDRGGHTVYNLPDWDYGYTTAIELYGSHAGAVKYITKYIGKSEHMVGGRWYLHGGDLREPVYEYCWTDYDAYTPAGIYEYTPEVGQAFKILNLV